MSEWQTVCHSRPGEARSAFSVLRARVVSGALRPEHTLIAQRGLWVEAYPVTEAGCVDGVGEPAPRFPPRVLGYAAASRADVHLQGAWGVTSCREGAPAGPWRPGIHPDGVGSMRGGPPPPTASLFYFMAEGS